MMAVHLVHKMQISQYKCLWVHLRIEEFRIYRNEGQKVVLQALIQYDHHIFLSVSARQIRFVLFRLRLYGGQLCVVLL